MRQGLAQASLADAHLKRHGAPSAAVVVAITNGRQDGFALLTRTFSPWERLFSGQAEWLAWES
jgi:GT2 family glycosyltransferase